MHAGKQILAQRYDEVKDAISTGTVDETKAVGEYIRICDVFGFLTPLPL